MGGCPYEILVSRTQIEVRAGSSHLVTIVARSTVDAAVNLMIEGGDLGAQVWDGKAPFQSISQAISKHGAAVDGITAQAIGLEVEIAQRREEKQQEMIRKKEARDAAHAQQLVDQAQSFGRATSEAGDPRLLLAVLDSGALLTHACNSAFKQFDVNKDGVLQPDEVQMLVASLCEKIGVMTPRPDKIQTLFERHDKSHDGLLQADEFETFYRAVLQSCAAEHKKMNPW